MMAIVNYFGLEIRQYNAINVFPNSELEEATYIKPLAG